MLYCIHVLSNLCFIIKNKLQYILHWQWLTCHDYFIFKINQHHDLNYFTLTSNPFDWVFLVYCNWKSLFSNIYLLTYEDDFVPSVITMHVYQYKNKAFVKSAPCVQLAPIPCNGQTWGKRARSLLLWIFIPRKPFSKTDIFVCVSGIPDSIRHAQIIIAHHHAPQIKKFLPVV